MAIEKFADPISFEGHVQHHTKDRQDFADGCFQPRARRASQSFGLAALAASLVLCRVMGLSHSGDLHALDGQLPCIFWPSGTSHTWPHRSHVQRVMDTVLVILSLMIASWGESYISLFSVRQTMLWHGMKWKTKHPELTDGILPGSTAPCLNLCHALHSWLSAAGRLFARFPRVARPDPDALACTSRIRKRRANPDDPLAGAARSAMSTVRGQIYYTM